MHPNVIPIDMVVILVVNEVDTIDITTIQMNIMKIIMDIMSHNKLRHQENLNNHHHQILILIKLIQVMDQHHQHRKQLMVVIILIHQKDNERLNNNHRVMVSNKEQ